MVKTIIYNCNTGEEEINIIEDPIKTAEEQKQDILYELEALDVIFTRQNEQTYIDMGKKPTYQKYIDVINRKNELRLQLKELSEKDEATLE